MAESTNPQIWLQMADNEFAYAMGDLKDEELDFFALTCFHFHQAAEKYLKAFILSKGKTFRKVHNLKELVKACMTISPAFKNLLEPAAHLTPYYTETRYPIHWPIDFTRNDARDAGHAAQEIRDLVKKHIAASQASSPKE